MVSIRHSALVLATFFSAPTAALTVSGCFENAEPVVDETGDPVSADTSAAIGTSGGARAAGGAGGAAAEADPPDREVGAGPSKDVFDAGSDPDRNRVRPGEICDRLSTIQCAGEEYCCDNPGRDYRACKEVMFRGCADDLMIDAISLYPEVGFDAVAAEALFADYEQRTSRCDTTVADWAASITGLRSAVKGTVDPYGDCNPIDLRPGTEGEAAALASCKDPANFACLPTGLVFWRCLPLNQAGGACVTDVNCIEGLYCDNPDLKPTGAQCKVRKPNGSPCELPNDCETLMCKKNRCVAADRQAVFCLRND